MDQLMEYPLCPDCNRPHDVAAALPFPRMSKCSEPNVVIGLLDRLETLHDDLHDDLDLARQEYTNESWERAKQDPLENEKLEKVKAEVGECTLELLRQHEAALEQFNRKMTAVARTWAALETQTGWLRSEVNTLRALTAVLGRVPDNPKSQATTEGMLNELDSDLTIFKSPGDAYSKETNPLKDQKAVNLPAIRVSQPVANGKYHQEYLDSSHSKDGRSTLSSADQQHVDNSDCELVKAQVDKVSAMQEHSLPSQQVKVLMHLLASPDARVQNSTFVDRSPPASRKASDNVQPSSEETKEDSHILMSIETQPPVCIETKSPSKRTDTEMAPIISVTLAVSPEKSSTTKRSWDDMVEEDLEPSTAGSQRRRTGLQTYTSIPTKSRTSKPGENSTAEGKSPVRRDLSANWRARRGSTQVPERQINSGDPQSSAMAQALSFGPVDLEGGKEPERYIWPNTMLKRKY